VKLRLVPVSAVAITTEILKQELPLAINPTKLKDNFSQI